MSDKGIQKTLSWFILRDGGGKWLGQETSLPVASVLLAINALADSSGAVKFTQAEISEALNIGLRTVGKCFVFLKNRSIISQIRRGEYRLAPTENLRDMRNECAQVADMRNGCVLGDDMRNGCALGASKKEADTIHNTNPKGLVSSAGARASTTDFQEKKEKIARLEEIVTRSIGPYVWNQSTSWHEMLERANWDMTVLTDAIVAYADKVTGSGQRHQFSRLYNFVVREIENKRRRAAMQSQARPNYNPPQLTSDGPKITESEMENLKDFFNV
jgi:hypothetical protein